VTEFVLAVSHGVSVTGRFVCLRRTPEIGGGKGTTGVIPGADEPSDAFGKLRSVKLQ